MIDFSIWMPIVLSFGLTAIIAPMVIPFLVKLKFGQFVRDDGPESHLKKAGTPTMGGIIFLAGIVLTCIVFAWKYPAIIPVAFMTVGFGIIGFIDDYLKVVKKQSEGFKPMQKMFGQLIVTLAFIVYYYKVADLGSEIRIPFTDGMMITMPTWLFVIFVLFVVLGTVNGTNFTDGLDGLASSVTIIVAGFFLVASMKLWPEIAPINGAVMGALMGFLLYNTHPAKVFMGDTGSLALGGYVAGIAIMLKMPLFIVIVGMIYLIEVLSVILQVGYFKLTHGKRIFKMAPIHHHFELSGFKETQVVSMFTIITVILCILGLIALK
ncbi:MAG: phospho-N-acetylmuramoyl-pentapeptide-transferase [Eubacterium sp.]|nr:phospho-N-acetylmuramoyl-pentapeptide-transferase [Eubacterium sp.]